MRELDYNLQQAQISGAIKPAVKVTVGDYYFTFDEISTCSNIVEVDPKWTRVPGGRILGVTNHLEEPYRASATVILNNHDGFLNDLQLSGKELLLAWGAYVEGGAIYSQAAPLRVKEQRYSSAGGKLTVELECFGIMQELDDDHASEEYTAPVADTVKTLLDGVLGATIAPYDTATSFRRIYDSEDALIDSIAPGASLVIKANESRLSVVKRLLDHTNCVARVGEEELDASGRRTIHIFVPTTSGTTYDSEYSLTKGEHAFFAKAASEVLTIPNLIVVKTPTGVTPAYSGEARDLDSINSYKEVKHTEYVAGLASDAEAGEIAQALMSKIQMFKETAAISAPMNCGAEIYDYVKVTDARQGDTIVGNIGVLKRSWKPGKYDMSFSFGGWLDDRKVLGGLGSNLGSGATIDTSIIHIHPIIYESIGQGDWGLNKSGHGWFENDVTGGTPLDGDNVSYRVYLSAGTYTLKLVALESAYCGIHDIDIDGTEVASFDMYDAYNYMKVKTQTDIAITSTGWKTLRVRIDGKNASSVGYFSYINLIYLEVQ